MKLSSKLYLLGLFLSAIIAVSGGTGLYHLNQVQHILAQEGSSLIKISGEIMGNITETHHIVLMEAGTGAQVSEMAALVDGHGAAFSEKIGQLKTLAETADIPYNPQKLPWCWPLLRPASPRS